MKSSLNQYVVPIWRSGLLSSHPTRPACLYLVIILAQTGVRLSEQEEAC